MTAAQTDLLKALFAGASLGSHLNSVTLYHRDGRSAKVLPSTVHALVAAGYLRGQGDNLSRAYRLTRAGLAALRAAQ